MKDYFSREIPIEVQRLMKVGSAVATTLEVLFDQIDEEINDTMKAGAIRMSFIRMIVELLVPKNADVRFIDEPEQIGEILKRKFGDKFGKNFNLEDYKLGDDE